MSSLLEKAILDAKALKEAAERTAKADIIEKYHDEVKTAIDNLLTEAEEDALLADPEEDELEDPLADPMAGGEDPLEDPLAGAGEDPLGDPMASGEAMTEEPVEPPPSSVVKAPMGFAGGEKLCPCPDGEEEIEINLDSLLGQEDVSYEDEEMSGPTGAALMEHEEAIDEQSSMAMGDVAGAPGPGIDEEDLVEEIAEAIMSSLDEEMEVDFEPVGSGSLNTNSAEFKEAAEATLAKETSDTTEENEEAKELRKKVQELEESLKKEVNAKNKAKSLVEKISKKNSKLEEKNDSILSTAKKLEEKLTEVNVTNAKLLYTNRILSDDSLNERQKNKIVAALKKTNSFDEAKTIYETLKNAVAGSSRNQDPEAKSLNEAMSGRMSPFLVRERRNDKRKENVVADRFKKLAGIK